MGMSRTPYLTDQRLTSVATLLVVIGCCIALLSGQVRGQDAIPADDPVAKGRAAFDDSYPWYDAPQDGIRRIEVEPTKQPWRFNWGSGPRGPGIPDLRWLAYVALGALGLLLAWVLYALIRAYLHRETLRALDTGAKQSVLLTDASRIEALPFPLKPEATSDLLSAARQSYEQGRYGEAIVYLFSHQLLELDKHQLIRLTRGKTNRQYLRELAQRRPLQGLLERTMVAFEDVYFGQHALDRQTFEACWTRLGEFDRLVGATA
jgi:hypothetical protein